MYHNIDDKMLLIRRKLLYLIHHLPENPHNGDRANSSELEFLKRLCGLGTEEEEGIVPARQAT
jgi:hypothetical protein